MHSLLEKVYGFRNWRPSCQGNYNPTYDVAMLADTCQVALSHYAQLPKKGKPHGIEWTVLATLVAEEAGTLASIVLNVSVNHLGEMVVISMATGSKCLPQAKRSLRGDQLVDGVRSLDTRKAGCPTNLPAR